MAAVVDFVGEELQVYRGADWSALLRFWTETTKQTGVDLSGRTYEAVLRRGGAAVHATSFDVDPTNLATGQITISLTNEATDLLDYDEGEWVLEETAAGVQTVLLVGTVGIADGIEP